MKYVVIGLVVLLFIILAEALAALILACCTSVLQQPLGTPDLTWWQSFVLLITVSLLGAAFNSTVSAKSSSN